MADSLPTDDYSRTLSRLLDNPTAIKSQSTIDAVTFLGMTESWIVTTVRVEGTETVFLQRINAEGGQRFVLPPAVTKALNNQRGQVLNVVRRRTASKAAATRKAKRS